MEQKSFSILDGISGKEYVIDCIKADEELSRRLHALGLTSGQKIFIESKANGGLSIKVNNTKLALNADLCNCIFVFGEKRENLNNIYPTNSIDDNYFVIVTYSKKTSYVTKKQKYPKNITQKDKQTIVDCANYCNKYAFFEANSYFHYKLAKRKIDRLINKYKKLENKNKVIYM